MKGLAQTKNKSRTECVESYKHMLAVFYMYRERERQGERCILNMYKALHRFCWSLDLRQPAAALRALQLFDVARQTEGWQWWPSSACAQVAESFSSWFDEVFCFPVFFFWTNMVSSCFVLRRAHPKRYCVGLRFWRSFINMQLSVFFLVIFLAQNALRDSTVEVTPNPFEQWKFFGSWQVLPGRLDWLRLGRLGQLHGLPTSSPSGKKTTGIRGVLVFFFRKWWP